MEKCIVIHDSRVLDVFYEPITGRYFKCTGIDFERKVEEFNNLRLEQWYENVSLNDWYDILGLPLVVVGESLRWDCYKNIGYLTIDYHINYTSSKESLIGEIQYDITPDMMNKYSNENHLIAEMKGESWL